MSQERLADLRRFVFGQKTDEISADHFLRLVLENLFHDGRNIGNGPSQIGDEDGVETPLGDAAEFGFALSQRLLRLFAAGDVSEDGDDGLGVALRIAIQRTADFNGTTDAVGADRGVLDVSQNALLKQQGEVLPGTGAVFRDRTS